MKEPDEFQMMPVEDIALESGAMEMATSPSMEPYLVNAEAAIIGHDTEKAKKAISELPLQRRYIWRIVSSLRQGFFDFDKSSVRADLATMDAGEFDSVMELLARRPVQFAILLRTVLGAEEMEQVMMEAIDIAKRY